MSALRHKSTKPFIVECNGEVVCRISDREFYLHPSLAVAANSISAAEIQAALGATAYGISLLELADEAALLAAVQAGVSAAVQAVLGAADNAAILAALVSDIPTADPEEVGAVFSDGGVLTISAGAP